MKDEAPFDGGLNAEAWALYHPGQGKRRPEWVPDELGRCYLGVSSLTKDSASDYEERVRLRLEIHDATEGFYGVQGDALAEAHLSRLTPYREIQVRAPLIEKRCVKHPTKAILPPYEGLANTRIPMKHSHMGHPGSIHVDASDRPVTVELPANPKEGDIFTVVKTDDSANPVIIGGSFASPEGNRFACDGDETAQQAWDLVGHIDGIRIHDERGRNIAFKDPYGIIPLDDDGSYDEGLGWPDTVILTIAEHKHKDADEGEGGGNVDLALRQATDYAAILDEQIRAGVRDFPLSDSEAERVSLGLSNARPLHIPAHVKVVVRGVSLHFWSRTEPRAFVHSEAIEPWRKAARLDRLRRKALAILSGPKSAQEWDLSPEGLQEHRRTMTAIEAGLGNESLLQVVLEYVEANQGVVAWEARKRDRSATAVALLAQGKQKRVAITNPVDSSEVWATPSAANNSAGRHLKPNLRGDWPMERVREVLEQLRNGKHSVKL